MGMKNKTKKYNERERSREKERATHSYQIIQFSHFVLLFIHLMPSIEVAMVLASSVHSFHMQLFADTYTRTYPYGTLQNPPKPIPLNDIFHSDRHLQETMLILLKCCIPSVTQISSIYLEISNIIYHFSIVRRHIFRKAYNKKTNKPNHTILFTFCAQHMPSNLFTEQYFERKNSLIFTFLKMTEWEKENSFCCHFRWNPSNIIFGCSTNLNLFFFSPRVRTKKSFAPNSKHRLNEYLIFHC